MHDPVPRRAARGSQGRRLGAVLCIRKLNQARSGLRRALWVCAQWQVGVWVSPAQAGWSRSSQVGAQGGARGRSITPSHRRPPTYLHCHPPAPACCPPPAASSSPSRPSGTCRSCTPGGRESGRLVRWQPCSPGISCLPGAHSHTLGTPSRGWAVPCRMHHAEGN